MSALWILARPYLFRLLAAGLLAAAAELAGLALLATATWLLVSAAGQPPLAALTVAIVSVRAFAVGRGTLRYAERLTGHDAVLRILAAVRERIFAGLVADRRPGAGNRSGDLLSRMVSDVEAVQDLLLRVLVPAAAAGAVSLAAVAGAAALAPAAAPVVAVGLLVAAAGLPLAGLVAVRRSARQLAPLRARVAVGAVDLARGAADLAAYGATGAATGRVRSAAADLARLEGRLAGTGAALDAAGTLTAGLTAAAVVLVTVRAGAGGVTVAVLAVGTLVAVEAAGLALLGAARRWAELAAPLARVGALLAAPVPGRPPGSAAGSRTADGPETTAGPVRLTARGVWARHPGRAGPALAGVDLDLPPGYRLAVVGPSGAGKSTLLAVLAGHHRPDRGEVLVAGAPVPAYPEESRHQLVGGLFADAHVFHAPIRANLLLADPHAGPDRLAAACRAAGLAEWLSAQPAGMDTVVGEDGGQLSGGERQRLLLARALLAEPAVLLLDEPTEGLAPDAAARVLDAVLAGAGPDRTVVLVTHQLLALAGADGGDSGFDEIVVLDGGRVSQRGSHAHLVASPGWYRDQFVAQSLAAGRCPRPMR